MTTPHTQSLRSILARFLVVLSLALWTGCSKQNQDSTSEDSISDSPIEISTTTEVSGAEPTSNNEITVNDNAAAQTTESLSDTSLTITTPTVETVAAATATDTGVTTNTGTATDADSTPQIISSETRYPLVQAFRSNESDKSIYAGITSVAQYEVAHFMPNNGGYLELLEVEKNYGDAIVTIMHAQNAGIGSGRINNFDASELSFVALVNPSKATSAAAKTALVYPGHWLFEAGSRAKKSISSTATTIKLKDVTPFAVGDSVMITYWDSANNTRDWSKYEEVLVTAIDTTTSILTVTRAQYATTALSWSLATNPVVVTPHAVLNDEDSRILNISTSSPVDPDTGLNGWEFFAYDYYYNIWSDWGTDGTTTIDAVVFDGGRWQYVTNSADMDKLGVDADNDGTADYGYIDGYNVLGFGTLKYLMKLRELLPDPTMILIDSSTVDMGYRAFNSTINGIEDENFMASDQSLGEAMTHLKQWQTQVTGRTALSYGFTKEDIKLYLCDENSTNTPSSNVRFRLGLAASLMTDTPHAYAAETTAADSSDGTKKNCYDTYPLDEYLGGKLGDWDWLGGAYTEATQITDNLGGTNLMDNATWDYTIGKLSTGAAITGYTASYTGDTNNNAHTLSVTAVPSPSLVDDSVYYPSVTGTYLKATLDSGAAKTKANEFTISFYAKTSNTYPTEYEFVDGVPRLVQVKIIDTNSKGYSQLVLIPPDETFYRFSFVTTEEIAIKKVMILSGEEIGSVTVRDVQLTTGSADRWVRYFENGTVVINTSNAAWSLELDKTYSTLGYKRLDGVYDTETNTACAGLGEDFTKFTVAAGDALFVANRTATDSADQTRCE